MNTTASYLKHLLVLCFFVVIFSTPTYAQIQEKQQEDKFLDIQTIETPSSIKAWLVEDHSVPVISLQFSFKGAGAVNDPKGKEGLARLASNTMDEGAGDLDSNAFQKKLQDLAITLRFNSSRDHFGGSLKTISKNSDEAFGLLKLALTQPRFNDAPLARMRKANQSRIRSSMSDPTWLAMRIMNDKAYAGHEYARNSGGTLSSLDNITADDLHKFHASLKRDDLHVAVAGDITAKELEKTLEMIFASVPKRTTPPPRYESISLKNTGQIFLHDKDIPQSIILMMQNGIDRKNPDYHTAKVMNYILGSSGFGSRLTKELREKRGLTYGIYSYFNDMTHIDTLSVQTSTKNETTKEALSLIKAEWEKMKNTPVTPQELSDAQSYLLGSLPLSLTSSDKIAGLMLSFQLDNLPTDYLETRAKNIKNITPAKLQTLASTLLTPKNFVTVLVGQPTEIDTFTPSPTKIEVINGVE